MSKVTMMMHIHTKVTSGIWAVIGSISQLVFRVSGLDVTPSFAVDFFELTVQFTVGFDLA